MSTRQHFAVTRVDIMFREKVAQIVQRHVVGRIPLKRLLDQWRTLAVNHHAFGAVIIQVAKRCKARKLAAPNFFAQTTLGVFGKRIHKIFTETKIIVEHELSLGRVFKPRAGKFEGFDFARIEHVDDPSAIHTVASKAVGMPCEDSFGLSSLYTLQHRIKNRSAGCFSRLFFNQFLDDLYAVARGKLAQFIELRVNGEDLLVLDIG